MFGMFGVGLHPESQIVAKNDSDEAMTMEEKIAKLEKRVQRLEQLAQNALYIPSNEKLKEMWEKAAESSCRILPHDQGYVPPAADKS